MTDNNTIIDHEVNLETGDYSTKAPWGETEGNLSQEAGLIKTGLNQLIFYKNDGRTPTQYLLDDIAGYEQILASKDPDKNARAFMDIKHDSILSGKRYENNLKIVEAIKEQGNWHE